MTGKLVSVGRRRSEGQKVQLIFLVTLALLSPAVAGASDTGVPPDLQAAIFQKIFTYDRTIESAVDILVVVVHDDDSSELAEDVARSFETVGISARAVSLEGVSSEIQNASAAYILPGASSTRVRELCTDHGVLSISGEPALVERGDVSIAIGKKGRKPQIIIHMNRLRDENHVLSAEVLKLATVIR